MYGSPVLEVHPSVVKETRFNAPMVNQISITTSNTEQKYDLTCSYVIVNYPFYALEDTAVELRNMVSWKCCTTRYSILLARDCHDVFKPNPFNEAIRQKIGCNHFGYFKSQRLCFWVVRTQFNFFLSWLPWKSNCINSSQIYTNC